MKKFQMAQKFLSLCKSFISGKGFAFFSTCVILYFVDKNRVTMPNEDQIKYKRGEQNGANSR
jgi:hypothetical protein